MRFSPLFLRFSGPRAPGIRVMSALVGLGLVVSAPLRDASACGGCFVPQDQGGSVVTEHRMALSVSQDQTVLWDQIRYQGDPKEFAWILPVRPGTRVEVGQGEWIGALEAATRPTVVPPPGQAARPRTSGGVGRSYRGAGCALAGCSAEEQSYAAEEDGTPSAAGASETEAPLPPPVSVLAEDVAGPYETAIVKSDDPAALTEWLAAHEYKVPEAMGPVLADYVRDGFDFVAIRLRPGAGVRAMQPVRIVTPGADARLPLRMVAAGTGAKVSLLLFVVAEGRYRPTSYPEGRVDLSALAWNQATSRSNLSELTQAALERGDGRSWITEYAGKPGVAGPSGQASFMPNLFDLYQAACSKTGVAPEPTDGGPSDAAPTDAAVSDAGANDAKVHDARLPPWCDDLAVATARMHPEDVWVTRLRANLPSNALERDLVLGAADQIPVSNVLFAPAPPKAPGARVASESPRAAGSVAVLAATAIALSVVLRRRRARAQPSREGGRIGAPRA